MYEAVRGAWDEKVIQFLACCPEQYSFLTVANCSYKQRIRKTQSLRSIYGEGFNTMWAWEVFYWR